MKPKRYAYTPVTQATNNISVSQTPGAAGNLTITGALAVGGVLPAQTLGYIIGIGCAANDSARTFTVTGFDENGKAQTEAIAGANIGTTASTKFWSAITTIAVDAATAGAIVVGTVNTTLSARGPTVALNIYDDLTSIAVDISGTINFQVDKAFERVTAGDVPNFVAHIAAGAIDVASPLTSPTGAVRLRVNSYTNGATIAMQVNQVSYGRS